MIGGFDSKLPPTQMQVVYNWAYTPFKIWFTQVKPEQVTVGFASACSSNWTIASLFTVWPPAQATHQTQSKSSLI